MRMPGDRTPGPPGARPDETARWGAAAAAVVVTLATALTAVALLRSSGTDTTDPAATLPGSDTTTPPRGPLAVAAPPTSRTPLRESVPTRVSVPAVGIDTRSVIELHRTTGGGMEVPGHAEVVGWLATTPTPGEPGAAVLSGHASYAAERGVFAGISRLRAGDEITVHRADGTGATFTVDHVDRVPRDRALERATAPTGSRTLRLLTTTGVFDRTDDDPGAVLVSARLTTVE